MLRPAHRAALALILASVAAVPSTASASETCADGRPLMPTTVGLPDLQRSGNRVIEPCGAFGGDVEDFELGETPAWVVAHPDEPGRRWILTLEDGRALELREGELTEVRSGLTGAEPPQATMVEGRLQVRPRNDHAADDPIPHGRAVSSGSVVASLAGPTDRYPHGVLGDAIEASALRITSADESDVRLELPQHEVIEGISALIAPLGAEGPPDILVTVSDADAGARLRAYEESGEIIAESEPVGTGFRWMHQIGVGPTGQDGQIEIIAVRTPHIGGIVEAYRLDGDRLERVASTEGYSSHVLGSPNLDMALLADADADGDLEVIVPTQSMTELAVLARTAAGFEEVMRLPLDGRLVSNVGAAVGRDGRLSLAAVTDDGRLRTFR